MHYWSPMAITRHNDTIFIGDVIEFGDSSVDDDVYLGLIRGFFEEVSLNNNHLWLVVYMYISYIIGKQPRSSSNYSKDAVRL